MRELTALEINEVSGGVIIVGGFVGGPVAAVIGTAYVGAVMLYKLLISALSVITTSNTTT
ncbi:hypothetical protein [Erwinia psidii]|uniref:Uncharacterized protein n=1 Tax=Erwinia psidii TaxID=69224 RepID=A0A3N6SLE7_9GAMM|nr:hypothetical protein [Erwinia psidii]MCX8960573.1 hypothetical protein [Erwinia psidii]RQM39661.1 hypothetical protein EB241_04345 [Erwinia psidii]